MFASHGFAHCITRSSASSCRIYNKSTYCTFRKHYYAVSMGCIQSNSFSKVELTIPHIIICQHLKHAVSAPPDSQSCDYHAMVLVSYFECRISWSLITEI